MHTLVVIIHQVNLNPCGSQWKGEVSDYNHTKEETVTQMGKSQILLFFKIILPWWVFVNAKF